jgi:hypothetical protein
LGRPGLTIAGADDRGEMPTPRFTPANGNPLTAAARPPREGRRQRAAPAAPVISPPFGRAERW